MLRWISIAIALALSILLAGCPPRDNNNDPVYPVWILNVYVWEQYNNPGARVAVRGCPHVTFHTFDNPRDSTVNCREGNYVKAWNHIDRSFTIQYTVFCDGYFPSEEYSAFFNADLAQQRPGRPGAEVEVNNDVHLVRLH
jgi:hypothetical protein